MLKELGLLLLCGSAGMAAHAEIFVIQGEDSGHEAVVKIPVSAVTKLSANFAESLVISADSQCESMRLTGDVLISIAGSVQPIQIKADSVVLELTPDLAAPVPDHPKFSRSEAASNKLLRSTAPSAGGEQVFVGNVVFDLATSSGPMQIKAERVEHRLNASESGPANGA